VRELGVGFLGAGLATQAIHLPTLQRFASDFRTVCVMDVDALLAKGVADLHGASWTSDEDELISHPEVDIVVVCSPDRFHARQLLKACNAGKAGVLAEKPLVLDAVDLATVGEAFRNSGTELVVGNMHAYDEAFIQALDRWHQIETRITAVDVRCYLPANAEMIGLATTLVPPAVGFGARAVPSEQELVATGITSLAIHDVPLVRQFVASVPTLDTARFVHPWGYFLQGATEDVVVRYLGMMDGVWRPDWSMTVIGTTATLRIDFQPSFVQSGSCICRIDTRGMTWTLGGNRSGYEAEWDEMRKRLRGLASARIEVNRALDDARYALDLVHQLPGVWKETNHA
jgi:myo-inositol 2-dehydrogenase / D-chiro-inositol 1-dehydrogenase